jgi:hypothetical protein
MEQDTSRDFKLLAYTKENYNRHFYNLFAQNYNEASKSTNPVQALSHLSQIKEDIEKVRATVYDRMLYVKGELEELAVLCNTDQEARISYFTVTVSQTVAYLLRGGYKVYDSNKFVVDKQELKDRVQYLWKHVNENHDFQDVPLNDYNHLISNIFKDKELLVYVNSQHVGLTDVISDVIKNGYPKEIETYSTDQEYQEDQEKKKLGRPLDESAPQKRIEEKVLELAKKEEFQHNDGKPKPTKIRDHILNFYPDIAGELKERALYNRVKKALKKYNMQ